MIPAISVATSSPTPKAKRSGVIMAGASAVAYIIGEGLADASHNTEIKGDDKVDELN